MLSCSDEIFPFDRDGYEEGSKLISEQKVIIMTTAAEANKIEKLHVSSHKL